MKFSKISFLMVRLAIICTACSGAGCRDASEEKKSGSTKSSSPGGKSSVDSRPLSKVRHRQIANREETDDSKLDSLEDIRSLIDTRGIDSIGTIFDSLEGGKRAEAMTIALSLLTHDYSKSDLIKQLAKLPAGQTKQQWIWQVVEKGQGQFDSTFFDSVRGLAFSEDKKTAINAFTSSAKVKSRTEFENAAKFVSSAGDIDRQFVEGMISNLLRSYSASLIQQGPQPAAEAVQALPENHRSDAVSTISKALSASDDTSALSFARSLESTPELSKKAYSSSFEQMGRTRPSVAQNALQKIPGEFRSIAVSGLVEGWLSQDASAASKWAGNQSGNDLKAASAAVVRYLENRRAPSSEIDPWRSLLK